MKVDWTREFLRSGMVQCWPAAAPDCRRKGFKTSIRISCIGLPSSDAYMDPVLFESLQSHAPQMNPKVFQFIDIKSIVSDRLDQVLA